MSRPDAIPLARLEKTFEGLTREQANLVYAQSADAVRALVHQAGLTGVVNLLAYIGGSPSLVDAFERATFMPYGEFVEGLAARWAQAPER